MNFTRVERDGLRLVVWPSGVEWLDLGNGFCRPLQESDFPEYVPPPINHAREFAEMYARARAREKRKIARQRIPDRETPAWVSLFEQGRLTPVAPDAASRPAGDGDDADRGAGEHDG